MTDEPCMSCNGAKLNPAVRGVFVGGTNLPSFNAASILDALAIIQTWSTGTTDQAFWDEIERTPPTLQNIRALNEREMFIGREIIKEIGNRLRFLALVGLDYLTLDRRANTLSGGESQRIRLATQIGTRLTGVMYVLDEPSIGLHPRDTRQLIQILKTLRNMGNSIIIVEHDKDIIQASDYIIDMGPYAGLNGGEIIYEGSVKKRNTKILTLSADSVEDHMEWVEVINNYKNKTTTSDDFIIVIASFHGRSEQ